MKMVPDDGTGVQVTIPVEADFLYVYSTADGLYGVGISLPDDMIMHRPNVH